MAPTHGPILFRSDESAVSNPADKAIAELVYRSCLTLDDMDIEGYMQLCASDFRYQIVTYSPEILRDILWKDLGKEDLRRHLQLVPRHVSDPNPLCRHPTVYLISYDQRREVFDVVTGFQVFKTALDGGTTELYAVGKYHDLVSLEAGNPLLAMRTVKLTTRQLGTGSQIPF